MDTTTANPPSPASDLPVLTPAQRCAALAWIDRGESTLRDVAAQLDLAADELLDILTQPNVAAYIKAAESIIQLRTSILARYDDIEARQSLVAIAKNPEADHATRLRAAITILQGPPPRRAPASPTEPGPRRPTPPARPRKPTPPEPPRPHRSTDSVPPPASTPARVSRAAGAPIARHDRIAAEPTVHIPRCASPATSGRPP